MPSSSTALLDWLQLSDSSDIPLYRQVYIGIQNGILSGQLRPDERLPASRELCVRLGVSRNTVQQAYDQLGADGLLEARAGAGTRVSKNLESLATRRAGDYRASLDAEVQHKAWVPLQIGHSEPDVVAFRPGIPAFDTFPRSVWAKLLRQNGLKSDRSILDYGHPGGYRPLKVAIARYLAGSRGVACHPDQIMVVTSARAAIMLVAGVRNEAGANAVVEDPGYYTARLCLEQAGLKIAPVPVDTFGIQVEHLDSENVEAAIAYVTPAHQWPTGVSLPIERRLALIRWAARRGTWIIEDDYDSEFSLGRPRTALAALAEGDNVFLQGTFSKTLLPSIRCAYVVVPPSLIASFQEATVISGIEPALYVQAALSDFMSEGHFTRYIQKMRKVYAQRRRMIAESLADRFGADVRVRPGAGGLQLVADLAADISAKEVRRAAARAQIVARTFEEYCVNAPVDNALHLGIAATPETEIAESVDRLAHALGR